VRVPGFSSLVFVAPVFHHPVFHHHLARVVPNQVFAGDKIVELTEFLLQLGHAFEGHAMRVIEHR